MNSLLYVATDLHGIQRTAEREVPWQLPPPSGGPGEVTVGAGPLVLLRPAALLDQLGERIYVAEPEEQSAPSVSKESPALQEQSLAAGPESPESMESPENPESMETSSARLISETSWNVERAAQLALDCAEHVLGDAAAAVLPGGATLGEVVAEARRVLERSSEGAERRLGTLARLFASRRLRLKGEVLGEMALTTLGDDLTIQIDSLDDPAWATIATVRDAVLGAVEAVRHLALPRYVEARERAYEDIADGADGVRELPTGIVVTPWGPITFGAEHQSGYAPSWVAARDAAVRARDAVAARDGQKAADEERSWQVARLEQLLLPGG